jgi:F-type H+-transporting ATPase subunit delta
MPAVEGAAKRYALAAFELAQEGNNATEWQGALEHIAAFMSETDVSRVLENSRVAQDVKQQLVEAGLRGLPPLSLNLARLLVKKGRSALAPGIATEFRQLVEEQEGIAHARAVTAVPLSDADRQALTGRLEQQTGRRIVLETEVDQALLGGLVVQIGDKLIDASTRARLRALRQSLEGAM